MRRRGTVSQITNIYFFSLGPKVVDWPVNRQNYISILKPFCWWPKEVGQLPSSDNKSHCYFTWLTFTTHSCCQIYSHQNNMLWSNDGKRSIMDELLFIVMTALIYHINKSHKKRNYSPLVTKHDKPSVPAFINSGFVNVENPITFIWHHSSL